MIRTIALLLTVLTGFSGLVYEITWQKYLATLLGSNSEATAAVLGLFLGGLSLGYSIFGRVTRRVVERAAEDSREPRLLLLYGVIEFSIGLFVLGFPWLFQAIQGLSFAIPHGPAGIGFAIDVVLSAFLIAPPAILMGGTIPILTQALSHSLADATRFHALVYAFNTAGAFVGALAAGFYLVPLLGLKTVMLAMGLVNLAAGSIFVLIGVRGRQVVSLEQAGTNATPQVSGLRSYAMVALLTGFALMTIQTTIIRLASVAFGSTQFTFSMVVAVFVLSIAIGSFVVSAFSRIPPYVIALNQCALALLFLALYPRLAEAPYWVHVLRTFFRDTEAAFLAYYAAGFLALIAVLGLPVLLSGAALPLLFHHLRREVSHLGDLAGYLYSWNTVGSLLGALVGGYALLFWLDLDQVYRLACGALLAAAVILTVRVYAWPTWTIGSIVPLALVLVLQSGWDPDLATVGLVRHRSPRPEVYSGPQAYFEAIKNKQSPATEVIAHTDDPTTTVVVQEITYPDGTMSRSITTDGKGDGDTRASYTNYALLAALPAMLAEKAERAFLVGWGIGITAGELASFDTIERVDVAEISKGVIEFAPLFDFANQRASQNPKIHLIQGDAYRTLMRTEGSYDIIVSQPSHVWVSGVEMLFSTEFLEAAKSKLSPGGVHCQWLQGYEIGEEAVEVVLETYRSVFDHVAVWHTSAKTLVLLGFESPRWSFDHFRLAEQFGRRDFKATLERAGVESFPALLAHELLPVGVVEALEIDAPIHSLYHPRLNDVAGRGFFVGETGWLPFTGFGEPARIAKERSMLQGYKLRFGGTLPDAERLQMVREACRPGGENCNAFVAEWMSEQPESPVFDDVVARVTSVPQSIGLERIKEMSELFVARPPGTAPLVSAERSERAAHDFVDSFHHGAPFDPAAMAAVWGRCSETIPNRAACLEVAQQGLATRRGDQSLEDLVDECMNTPAIGDRCREGLAWSRRLGVEGEFVPLEEGLPTSYRRPPAPPMDR